MMPHRPQSVQSRLGDRAESEGQTTKMGKVYLVGAGPGDPGLITIRGAECLAQADLVLYDGLANPKLLQLAPRAEHRSVGKHGDSPLWTQGEINAALVAAATAGQCVVRLKGGDPAVFARTAEELDALVEAGVPFEVVPGITAALAAASYVGIPITHRDHASAVAFITGQQQTDGAQDLDWPALAKFPGTLVFYMGVTTAGLWSQRLIEAGKSADTPAAIVRRCSWSDQQVIRCPLGRVAEHLTPASKLRPPVIVIIGEVARLGEAFDWFASRPLHRTGIWLTRPTSQNQQLERQLSDLGADVFVQPAIEICPTLDQAGMDAALERLAGGDFAGVAFTSKHAVDAVCDRLWELGYDQRVFAGVQLASVGDKTSQVLAARGLRADWVPAGQFNAERLLEVLASRASVAGQAWFLPQADRAREILAEGLLKLGAAVEAVEVYRALPPHQLRSDIVAALEKGLVQWVTVTSSQAARTLHELCQPYLRQLRPLSLSPAISQVLKELGWPAAAEARQATEESMVEALLEATAKSSA